VVLTSELDNSEVKLIANPEEPSAIGLSEFSAEQEWKLAKDVTTWSSSKVRTTNNKKSRHPVFSVAVTVSRRPQFSRHPVFSVAVTVSRRPQFFIWNIITMMVSYPLWYLWQHYVDSPSPEGASWVEYIRQQTTRVQWALSQWSQLAGGWCTMICKIAMFAIRTHDQYIRKQVCQSTMLTPQCPTL